ncbi:MAG: cyanophycin synthetase [Vicinamibacterales bacterium]
MASVSGRLSALEGSGIKLGLANISRLCEALGHPERAYTTIHVAGTNGKGSVVAMVHRALRAAGLRAARFTSPHLSTIHERFVAGDDPVTADVLESAGANVLDAADALVAAGTLAAPPTYFEATTAIAFELFRRSGMEVAVIEVGLGGRFDSTNVVAPAITAITSIALDHEAMLGRTRAAIAFEKAGIIKPDTPVVVGPLAPDADAVVRAVATSVGAEVIDGRRRDDGDLDSTDGHARVVPSTGPLAGEVITVGLAGAHQADNALVAYRVLEYMASHGPFHLPSAAIRNGLTSVTWPGRLEEHSLHGGRTLILDAAHNPHGARALAEHLRRWFTPRPVLIFAAMADKDIRGILTALLPVVGPVVLPTMASPRAASPALVRDVAAAIDPGRDMLIAPDASGALALAWQRSRTVVAAGSIVLVGEVRDALTPRAILR